MENRPPRPPARFYDTENHRFRDFKTLIITTERVDVEIFKYENANSTSDVVITRQCNYNYVAFFSKMLPSAITSQKKPKPNDLFEKGSKDSDDDSIENDFKSFIILEDLTMRYGPYVQENQYIIIAFKIKNHNYDEHNEELKYMRDLVGELHFNLKYSDRAIRFQVSQRIQHILYKTLKYSLCYIAEMANISPGIPAESKLHKLQTLYYEPAFREFVRSILEDQSFKEQLISIAYKTIAIMGIFPSYVELNTMNEMKFWLKIKNIFTNQMSAPYGSKHHASFSLGNLRYSFIFDPNNKEKQKVSINFEIKRGFSLKNKAFEYFRLKFFDFFPMNSWVLDIANEAEDLLAGYFIRASESLENGIDLKDCLWDYVSEVCGTSDHRTLHNKLAKEFFERYRVELSDKTNGKIFRQLTQLISDAEMRGYSNLNNNCQTIVSEIVALFSRNLQRYVEPLFDISKIPHMDDEEKRTDDFLTFGSQFNNNFDYIGPFSMTYRLSYFDVFTDKDTQELLSPKNFDNIMVHVNKYLEKDNIKEFVEKIEEGLLNHNLIHITETVTKDEQEVSSPYPDIKYSADTLFSCISCLLIVKYNELFNLKREIKIAKLCQQKLESEAFDDKETDKQLKKKKKDANLEKLKVTFEKLPELYEQKYKTLALFKELCYYYYNTIRLAIKTKMNDTTSYFGFLITKKPEQAIKVKLSMVVH